MLAKLIDGALMPVPQSYWRETPEGIVTVSNYDALPEEDHLADGWKPVIETEPPEPQEGIGYYPVYTEEETRIVQGWEEYEIPPPQPDPIEELQAQVDELKEFVEWLMEGFENG